MPFSFLLYIIFYFIVFLCTILVLCLFALGHEIPTFRLIWNTLGRDIIAGYRFLKMKFLLNMYQKPMAEMFYMLVKKHPNKACFIYEDQKWTYQQVEDFSNQVANCFAAEGFQKGDDVALFMENRLEYVPMWLGLSKIGVVPALINTNQRLNTLAHSVNVVNTTAVIFTAELSSAVKEATDLFNNKENIKYYCLDKADLDTVPQGTKFLNVLLNDASKSPPDKKKYNVKYTDKLLYIYTSGTTGLPKAAIMKHRRVSWIGGMRYMFNLSADEIYYNPLPMYHTAGGLLMVSVVLTSGGTMIIRKKFSASNFWSDCTKHKATLAQYIGEICRYLLNQPKRPEENMHKVKVMIGNGLRPQLWKEFAERFKIDKIIEIYGATEGNSNAVNIFGKVGAVGFVSRLFSRIYPACLIRVDQETGEPIRDENGLCIRCKPGEPGEMVGKIIPNDPVSAFDGYVDSSATKKKIIYDCFEKGDMAFISGDVLVMDEDGYLYFMDRTGDTFRWRGENVSTNEVEDSISKTLGLVPCVVFGVQIPNVEGNAGMAVIEIKESEVDMNSLYTKLSKTLPSYAMPLFVRIAKSIESTGTYKLKKTELRKDGYDPEKCTDSLYFLDPKTRTYIKFDKELHRQLCEGKLRL